LKSWTERAHLVIIEQGHYKNFQRNVFSIVTKFSGNNLIACKYICVQFFVFRANRKKSTTNYFHSSRKKD